MKKVICAKPYGRGYGAVRNACLKAANYLCQMCKTEKATIAHHRKPVRLLRMKAEIQNQDNLIAVCRACHVKAERESKAIYG
jgi:5-methylcytosine-specific restriction endonuclease McrA